MTEAAEGFLAGKHALVTGGAKGIGLAITRALAGAGAKVSILARDPDAAEAVLADLPEPGLVLTADVADRAAVERVLDRLIGGPGAPQILVNNAGVSDSAPFHRMEGAHWDRMLAVNLTGVFNVTRPLLPAMKAGGWGRILSVASTAGQRGYAYVAAYCAAKHGVIGMTRALALELARTPITVNALCPGYTESPMLERSLEAIAAKSGRPRTEAAAFLTTLNPQNRFTSPEEVAGTVLWLCRDEASGITGQAISISGGEVMA